MQKLKYGYGWLIKWVLAAILIGVGLAPVFANGIVYLISGIFIVTFSLLRVYPLLKTLKKEGLRTLNLVEIILDTILGGLLLYVGVRALQEGSSWDPGSAWGLVYKYSLVFVLIFRAIVFFYSVTFLGEKTEQPKFWAHIGLLSLGSIISVLKDFTPNWIAWMLLVIAVLGAIYLAVDGYFGYRNYRKYQAELNADKVKKVKATKVEKNVSIPSSPSADKPNDQHSILVDKKDDGNDKPTIIN
mgnify:CR=1 FL=1